MTSDPMEPTASESRSAAGRMPTLRHLARGSRRYTLPWISPGRWRQRFLLVAVALIAGAAAILFAVGADKAISYHRMLFENYPWAVLIVAPAIFAGIAWLTRNMFRGAEGSGIPQSVAASGSNDPQLRSFLLSPRIAIGKILMTLAGLAAGASIGREGPTVQVGASIMHTLSHKRLGRVAHSRDLIIAGGGAGVAAAFNTPIGGIMFAIEELSRHKAFKANSTTLTAVIFAGLMSLALLGNYTYFGRTQASLIYPDGVYFIFLLGAIGGLLGGGFTRLLIASARGLPGRLGTLMRERPIAFAALCGLATALLELATGGLTMGTGYTETREALDGQVSLPVYFMFAKLAGVWLAFVSGIPGGMFAPALAVGAGLGEIINLFTSGTRPAAIMVLGMVAFLAGMTQAPITSFVIVMEMTANHEMLLPLMATSVIAHGCARTVAPIPLYHALAGASLRTAMRRLAARTQQTAPAAPPPASAAPAAEVVSTDKA